MDQPIVCFCCDCHASDLWIYPISEKRSEEKGHVLGHYTLASVVSPLLFFAVSNFGVWAGMNMYPPTLSGLSMCYVSALPFLTYGMALPLDFL